MGRFTSKPNFRPSDGFACFMAHFTLFSGREGIMPMTVATHQANTKLMKNMGQIQDWPAGSAAVWNT